MLSNYLYLNFIIYLFCFFLIISAVMVILSANPIHSVFFLILVVLCISGLFLCLEIDFLGILLIIVYVGAIAVLFLFVVMMLNLKVDAVNENLIRYFPILGFFFFIFLINSISFIFPYFSYNLFFSFFDLYVYFFNELSEILSTIGYVPLDLIEFFYRWALIGDFDELEIISGSDCEFIQLFYYLYNYDMVVSNYFNNNFNINMISGVSAFGFSIYYYFAFSFILISIILLVAMMGPIVLTLEHRKLVKRQDIQIQVERDFSKTIVLIKNLY